MNTNSTQFKESVSDFFLSAIDIIVSIIKWFFILSGVLAAQLADAGFGTIALGFLFSGSAGLLASIKMTPNYLGLVISLGASAFQIYMWTLMHQRGIGVMDLFRFKKLDKDIKQFMAIAVGIWFIDTAIDISPISLMVKNSTFGDTGIVYKMLVCAVYIMAIILCGFSEILTSNLKEMMSTKKSFQPSMNNRQNTFQQQKPKSYPPVGSIQNKPAHQPTRIPQQNSQQTYHPIGSNLSQSKPTGNYQEYLRNLQQKRNNGTLQNQQEKKVSQEPEFDEDDINDLMAGFEDLRAIRGE